MLAGKFNLVWFRHQRRTHGKRWLRHQHDAGGGGPDAGASGGGGGGSAGTVHSRDAIGYQYRLPTQCLCNVRLCPFLTKASMEGKWFNAPNGHGVAPLQGGHIKCLSDPCTEKKLT
ncbi:hypothetical protein C5167_005412 [Papaver somniferum]|uniref:Uncharacterized protein n=1 Tax=Papaver somniferum TaxID=3469 RepID=A0A4Y7JAH7_PAPSO|nr:hypothetical protein C5167_005412 [Papaver somniferum]